MIDAPIVWEQPQAGPVPSVLQTWADARGLRLVQPTGGGRHAIAIDASVASRVEEALHAARELVTQHDTDGAERALARAEALLCAHPELPQAPWLLAEVERGWASRFARLDPVDAARAARDWRAAAALDGGRAAGVGEPSATADANVAFSIELAGPSAGAELRLDGEPIAPGEHQARAGLHQVVARQGGAVVFAEWIYVAPGAAIRVALPTPEACSTADLASGAPACPSWVAARRGDAEGTFFVRVCEAGSCGPDLLVAPMTRVPDHHVVVRHGLAPWAAWTLGVGGVILGGIAAGVIGWAALPTTTKTVFTTGGKPQ